MQMITNATVLVKLIASRIPDINPRDKGGLAADSVDVTKQKVNK